MTHAPFESVKQIVAGDEIESFLRPGDGPTTVTVTGASAEMRALYRHHGLIIGEPVDGMPHLLAVELIRGAIQ